MLTNVFSPASDAFVVSLRTSKPPLVSKQIQHKISSLCLKHDNSDDKKYNTSKIYKMDFSDDDDLEWFLKPKYALGLSEFHFTLLKIYVYMVSSLHIITEIMMKK
jgi:hypothetical protein